MERVAELSNSTQWFLEVALDQVKLMSSLFDIQTLAKRLRSLVECSETLKLEAAALLEAADPRRD